MYYPVSAMVHINQPLLLIGTVADFMSHCLSGPLSIVMNHITVNMCHPVCGMTHIKESLLLIGKSSPMWQQWVSFLAI